MHHYQIDKIRNILFLSHSGAGKTSLTEAILFAAGAINRLGKVDEGTTTSDYDPEEVKRKISINLSILPCVWKDTKLNLIDTPGYPDFVGEVKAGLRVSDGAIIVVCAASGIEVGTEQVWNYVTEAYLPCLIWVNKMDRDNADFFRTVEEIQSKFGKKCLPVQLPIGAQKDFKGIVDLLTLKGYGASSQEIEIPPSVYEQANSYREKLIEAAVEEDDELIAKYLEGEEISNEEICHGLRQGVVQRKVVPILVGSALAGIGIIPLLNNACSYLPAPNERGAVVATNPATGAKEEIEPSPTPPLAVLIFKTSTDPYVGKLNYLRVYSGTILSNSQIWNAAKNGMERIGQLFVVRGKNQEPVPQLIAGDIGAVAKLALATTGDTFTSRDHPLLFSHIEFPKPVFGLAVYPKSKADLDKMGTILPKLCEEDPTFQVRREADTNEVVLFGIGETHLEAMAERMQRKFGVEVKLELPKVPFKETISIPVKAEYKHKKQTGGHGQYGHVFLELEPLPRGSGFEFTERIVGGAVPKNYVPAVEKGVNEAKQEGVLAGYPVVDVKVTLYDGSYHPVDSSDISFKIAGAQALKKGLSQGQPVLLEPIVNLTISVPENFTGDILGDINTKRGRVLGMNRENGKSVIQAQAPLAEILRYAVNLRAITQGRGSYVIEFSHYEELPAHIAQKVISERQAEKSKS